MQSKLRWWSEVLGVTEDKLREVRCGTHKVREYVLKIARRCAMPLAWHRHLASFD
jgi:hypothetical protein